MERSSPEFGCEACAALSPASALLRDQWGDPCCPACRSPRITRHRSRMSAVLEAWVLFNVF